MHEPLIASNSDTDPEHDSDSSEDGCSIFMFYNFCLLVA